VRRAGRGAVLAAATLLVLFFALPIVAVLVRAVVDGGVPPGPGRRAVEDALVLSLVTTAASLAVIVLLGTPLAFVLSRWQGRLARVVDAVVDLPIVLPPAVAGLALLLLLGRRGPLGGVLAAAGIELPFTTAAVVLAQVFVAGPFFVRSARTGFAGVERNLEDAARVDGADEAGVVRHVTLPLAAPALAAGMVLAWSRALGEFGATILFAGNIEGVTQTLPLTVYSAFQSSLEAAIAAAAVLIVAAAAVLVVVRVVDWRGLLDIRIGG
jgi:molybdate transport system permease protein